jgi:hypothetical protein
MLDVMRPAFAADSASAPPRRMLAVCNNLGLLPSGFFPKNGGKDYELSPYLRFLAGFREELTVFSGVSHPDVDGSHSSEVCFLTAAPHPANGGFKNSISLDQAMADPHRSQHPISLAHSRSQCRPRSAQPHLDRVRRNDSERRQRRKR